MIEQQPADSLEKQDEPKSSAVLLAAITGAEKSVAAFNQVCQQVDDLYSLKAVDIFADDNSQDFQLFWASMEILKPSIYARPPVPVVAPRFKDRDPVIGAASEMLERALTTAFAESEIDEVMLETRDDLALNNRGVQWLTYESDDGQKVCIEHLDRTDFLHEPARKWSDVGWVARRAWMTRAAMAERFKGVEFESANFIVRREAVDQGASDGSAKAGVWEVWSKTDNRVYWVTDGVPTILDEDPPHLNLKGFFPCPRPAYGTRKRRSLVPVPDYLRYGTTLGQISELTTRVYDLLREVRLRGFFPAGGDIGEALETAIADQNSSSILIPVPAAAFIGASGGTLVQWLPLDLVATAIQGLITARQQLIQDFYEISGISDIMRGATDAQETLGAQQLKQQNGSIRVRDKVDELTRIAADTANIAGEIMAEHFSAETLMDMSQMKFRTKAEIKKALGELEKTADAELRALGDKAKQAMEQQQGQMPPEQAEQMQAQFNEAQQAIIAKYQPQIEALAKEVPIDDVMKLLRDERTRGFVIEIETDSTVLTDDMAEKASRAEFLNAFNAAASSIMVLAQAGEAGAELAGGMIKFALAPFRVGRELDGMIDKFVEDAEGLAKQAGGQDDGAAELAQAQQVLAQAEMTKAEAQVAKVQADTAAKGMQMQMDAKKQVEEMQAKIDKAMSDLQLAGAELQLKSREVAVKERDVAIKEAQAGVQIDATATDTQIKKGEAAVALGLGDANLPAAVAATLAPAMTAQQAQVEANIQALRDQIAALAAVLSAPKEILRGPDGRAVGVRVVQ